MSNALLFQSGGVNIRMHAEEQNGLQSGTGRRPAILLLHGSGGHADFWTARLASLLAPAGIGLYAPHYFDRTGTGRADLALLTDGVHVPKWLATVNDALHFVSSRPGVDPQRIVIVGISLGGFLALALASQLSASSEPAERSRVAAIVDISGGLVPPYDALATASMPPTLILHGAADNIVPVSFAHQLDRKLSGLGIPHRTEILPNEAHWFSPAALPRLLNAVSGFLVEHLRLQTP